ncbi:MAG: VCBS repeat-containing protein [Sedimentisphaerales bacterium]|nr:VCBS repeat-containing protein [Sedimentisphaerales bacterium]
MRFQKVCLIVLFAVIGGMNLYGAAKSGADANAVTDLWAYYGFGEMEMIKLGWDIKNLRTADFNRDGLMDIAVVNNTDSRIEILLQKSAISAEDSILHLADANDTNINELNPPSKFRKMPVPVSVKIASFVCGDLNGDGLADIVFYGEPRALYILLQKPAGADEKKDVLSWKALKKIKIDDGLLNSNSLECADINNDGKADLILAGADAVYVICQQADGTLAEAIKYPTTSRILAVRVADFNGDKLPDLMMITNDAEKPLSIRFGQQNGQLGPEIRFDFDAPSSIDVCNYDGIGGAKILSIDAKSGRFKSNKVVTEKPNADEEYPILFYPLPVRKENAARDMVIGDVDGDGFADMVISDPGAAQLILYRQIKGMGLDTPAEFPAFADIASLSVADINKDGRDEIGVLSVKEKTIGISRYENKRLTFPVPLEITGEPLAMQFADVDGDGTADCVYVSKDANDVRQLRVRYTLAVGEKSKIADSVLELKKLTANPDGLKVFDADHDGLQDVLIFVSYDQPIMVRQIAKGIFEIVDSPNSQASLIKEAKASSTAVAKIDGKKGDDLLVAQQNFARSLRMTDGKWTIVDQYNAKSTENVISGVAAFDIDNDGYSDILLLDGQKGRLQILKAGDDKMYHFVKEIDISTWNIKKILFSPLTGTAAGSVVLFDADKFALITPRSGTMKLEQQFGYETTIKEGKYANFISGDLNSDGRNDFAIVEYKRNYLEILTLNDAMQPISATSFKVFEQKSYREEDERRGQALVEPSELVIADVTGDGKNDLITITHDRIIIYPQN